MIVTNNNFISHCQAVVKYCQDYRLPTTRRDCTCSTALGICTALVEVRRLEVSGRGVC